MAETPREDPFAMWRGLIDTWERRLNEVGTKVLGEERVSAAVHKASIVPLALQKTLGDAMSKYLAAMNLPSREDVHALGERLGLIERDIRIILQTLAPPSAPAASPPRTRKPQAAKKDGAAKAGPAKAAAPKGGAT